jgi:MerR family Zn(II)-responsive transcriptional regulator of zntA
MENEMIVHELAESAGVSPSAVRYYSRIGLLHPVRNPDNGYRDYSAGDVNLVRFIRKAQWLGFTLKDVETILEHVASGESPCSDVRRLIIERMTENQQRLHHLQAIQERMEAAIESWKSLPDGPPNQQHICDLIASLECDEDLLDLYPGHRF